MCCSGQGKGDGHKGIVALWVLEDVAALYRAKRRRLRIIRVTLVYKRVFI